MTEFNPLSDPNQTPEDVATLYSWANLHGAKYRDFSASRAQTREMARLRAEQAAELERLGGQEAAAAQAAETERSAEGTALDEEARQSALLAAEQAAHEAEMAAEQAARHVAWRAAQEAAAQDAAEMAARIQAEEAARKAAKRLQEQAAQFVAQQAAQRAAEQAAADRAAAYRAETDWTGAQRIAELPPQHPWQVPHPDRFSTPEPPMPRPPQNAQPSDYTGYAAAQSFRPSPGAGPSAPSREESTTPRNPWAPADSKEPFVRPAWLSSEQPAPPAQPRQFVPGPPASPQAPPNFNAASPIFPPAPEDTLQGSRDRLASRWFALRGVFDGPTAQAEAAPAAAASRAPAMAVFSLAGGVGKTSLVATLGRALSARGERILLVDTAAFGLLPFFFGATDQRPGLLRTFSPPGASSDAPIQMVTLDPESLESGPAGQESLSAEILKFARGASRILVDLATASGATTRRIMRLAPQVLVPVVPDMNSVVSVSSIDAFFEHTSGSLGKASLPYYILNQFDASLPLHLDVREVLREQLGERLLPFALRRAPAMSEALAEGMTVMDYAPGSLLAEDFATLAGWVKSLSAPATTGYRGVRWSER